VYYSFVFSLSKKPVRNQKRKKKFIAGGHILTEFFRCLVLLKFLSFYSTNHNKFQKFSRKFLVKNTGKILTLSDMVVSVHPAVSLVLFSFLQLLCMVGAVEASIQVLDLGRVYQSRPDKYFGLQMRNGLEYQARLQRLPDNLHLCGNQPWNVTVPPDGLPGV
jgi:hypothetical protein